MNFVEGFELFQTRGEHLGFAAFCPLQTHFPGRGTSSDTLQGSRLACSNNCHLQTRSERKDAAGKQGPHTTANASGALFSSLTSKRTHVDPAPTTPAGEGGGQEVRTITFSLGRRLMVFRGLKTRSTRRDLMVLMSRPLLVLPRRREAQGPGNERETHSDLAGLGWKLSRASAAGSTRGDRSGTSSREAVPAARSARPSQAPPAHVLPRQR